MLKIRSEQMEALEQDAIRNFEQRITQHLQEFFPKHTELLGEEPLRQVIHYGLEQTRKYGLTAENSVILFTDLMFLLGRGFDKDPQLPWAAQILKDENIQDEVTRTQRLYETAIDYLNRVSGEKNEHIDVAQARIRDEKLDDLIAVSPATLPEQLLLRFKKIFPQKYEFVGESRLRQIIQEGITTANKYGITDNRGIAVYVGLMFMLGSSFDTDPLFSWASEILENKALLSTNIKTDRLYEEAMNYLSLWCPN